jgi:hypothetical protein
MGNHRLPAALLCLLQAATAWPSLACAQSRGEPSQLTEIGALSPDSGSAQRRAAEAGLAMLTERRPSSRHAVDASRIFDIADTRALQSATIGDGFEVYFVNPAMLLSGKRLGQSLYGSGVWRFIVMANGKGVGLVTVALLHGRWTMVEAGASELAGEIASIASHYAQPYPGARLRFIRSRQAVADFVEVVLPNATHGWRAPVYIPLASARAALSPLGAGTVEPASALSEAQVDTALRPRVRRGMRDLRTDH